MKKNSKTIYGSISINTPKHTVWNVLFNDQYTRLWYAEFSEGSYAKTDWSVGSKAIFTDDTHSGLVGKILINKPDEELVIEYEGILTGGVEVYDTVEAKAIKGGKEKYFLAGNDTVTKLSIECDMIDELFDFMSAAWEKALLKVKELSESSV